MGTLTHRIPLGISLVHLQLVLLLERRLNQVNLVQEVEAFFLYGPDRLLVALHCPSSCALWGSRPSRASRGARSTVHTRVYFSLALAARTRSASPPLSVFFFFISCKQHSPHQLVQPHASIDENLPASWPPWESQPRYHRTRT